MSFHRKKSICIFLLLFILLFFFLPWTFQQRRMSGEDRVKKEKIVNYHRLFSLLLEEEEGDISEEQKKQLQILKEAKDIALSWKEGEITYKNFQPWFNEIEGCFDLISEKEEEQWKKKYKRTDAVGEEDADQYIALLLERLDKKGELQYQNLLFLGDYTGVTDLEGNPIEKDMIFTNNGSWKWEVREEILWRREHHCLTYQGGIWNVEETKEITTLSNVWIVDRTKEELTYFYKNYYIKDKIEEENNNHEREQVADLFFQDGLLNTVNLKTDKITGRVMKLTEEELELREEGSFPLADEIQYYKLHGPLKAIGRGEVPLGYSFTDFVIEEGKIVAALVTREEKMESIRVLLKTKDFQSYFHEEIIISAQVDLEIISADKVHLLLAGESLRITKESELFQGNRIYIKPKALTGKTFLPNLERNNQGQGYYGSFEVEKREEGLLLINELLLEEYLYAVVPSEMPGYYPLEALKAQAISARTYAYQRLLTPGLSSYGANLDDSSTYQVYNNISENPNTTKAVKETKGKLLYAGEQLAATYYYSTSCGVGTDGSIWSMQKENSYPYLKAREMTENNSLDMEALQKEEEFADFITKSYSSHLEQQEGWYRWCYEHSNLEKIKENVKKRLLEYPQYVVVNPKEKEQSFLEGKFVIEDIKVKQRGPAGTAETITFFTDIGILEVSNEYHIRAVLTDGESLVNLQNGNTYACGSLLPSAFFILDIEKKEEKVKGIRILGGGFGHGVGMSQNGAKALANLGYQKEEILAFYYQGCEVRE